LAHNPIEQATERPPGKEIKILKDIASKYGEYTFFKGGHFHKMHPPKTETGLAIVNANLICP